MSTRTDLPKVKHEQAPSVFNHEAGKWGFISGMLAGIGVFSNAMIAGTKQAIKSRGMMTEEEIIKHVGSSYKTGIVVVAAAEVGGALIGGLKEKNNQEQAVTDGRVVKTPGYWNKGILSGLLASSLVQAPFSYSDMSEMAKTGKAATRSSLWLAVPLIGAIIGSIMRRSELQRDFDKAVAIREEEMDTLKAKVAAHEAKHEEHAPVSYKDSVSPEEAEALAEKQQKKPHSTPEPQMPAHAPKDHHDQAKTEHKHTDALLEKREHKHTEHPLAEAQKHEHKPHTSHTERHHARAEAHEHAPASLTA